MTIARAIRDDERSTRARMADVIDDGFVEWFFSGPTTAADDAQRAEA
ncbi:MAG: hypothetical protein ACRCS9_04315 [Hyphomicrobium sp.]